MPDHVGDRGAAHLDPGASRSPTYQPCEYAGGGRCLGMETLREPRCQGNGNEIDVSDSRVWLTLEISHLTAVDGHSRRVGGTRMIRIGALLSQERSYK
jgi:hypothetical protein